MQTLKYERCIKIKTQVNIILKIDKYINRLEKIGNR